MSARPTLLTVAFLIGLETLPAHAQQGRTQAELNAAASNAVDRLLTNHDYGGQRFVDAKEITRDNAGSLRAVCVYQAADLRPFHTNPLVYRGVMYLTTSHRKASSSIRASPPGSNPRRPASVGPARRSPRSRRSCAVRRP